MNEEPVQQETANDEKALAVLGYLLQILESVQISGKNAKDHAHAQVFVAALYRQVSREQKA